MNHPFWLIATCACDCHSAYLYHSINRFMAASYVCVCRCGPLTDSTKPLYLLQLNQVLWSGLNWTAAVECNANTLFYACVACDPTDREKYGSWEMHNALRDRTSCFVTFGFNFNLFRCDLPCVRSTMWPSISIVFAPAPTHYYTQGADTYTRAELARNVAHALNCMRRRCIAHKSICIIYFFCFAYFCSTEWLA